MEFADAVRAVSGTRESVWDELDLGRECDAVVDEPMMTGIEPGEDRAPARRADLVRRHMGLEASTARGKPVQRRGPRKAVPKAAEGVGPQLVGHEQHKVWHPPPSMRFCPVRLAPRCRASGPRRIVEV